MRRRRRSSLEIADGTRYYDFAALAEIIEARGEHLT